MLGSGVEAYLGSSLPATCFPSTSLKLIQKWMLSLSSTGLMRRGSRRRWPLLVYANHRLVAPRRLGVERGRVVHVRGPMHHISRRQGSRSFSNLGLTVSRLTLTRPFSWRVARSSSMIVQRAAAPRGLGGGERASAVIRAFDIRVARSRPTGVRNVKHGNGRRFASRLSRTH
jgi:hypothetical protein